MQPLLALVLMFGLMWVVLIRPQQRRLRAHQAIVSSLQPGDEVVTAGGIYGTIQSVDDDSMLLEVAPGIELRVLRAAVSQRVADDGRDELSELDDEDDDIDVVNEADAVPELADPMRDEEA
jgi:preprotein translocase subunit YajC